MLCKIVILIQLIGLINSYQVPTPTFEIGTGTAKGFTVSIPDSENIKRFNFCGKLNRPLSGLNGNCDYDGVVTAAENGKWIYKNSAVTLNSGDIIYYRIKVTKQVNRRKSSFELEQQYTIENKSGPSSTNTTRVLNPKCIPSMTVLKGETTTFCKGDIIFDEDFNNLDNWKHVVEFTSDEEAAEFVSYQKSVCRIENGRFIIEPKLLTETEPYINHDMRFTIMSLNGCTGHSKLCHRYPGPHITLPPVVSCKIRTKDKFNFKYGEIEIHAKFPKGDWIFPQLFLDPATYSPNYGNGQMRIGFIRGNEQLQTRDYIDISGSQLFGGVILRQSDTNYLHKEGGHTHFGNDFHKYGLIWTNESIVLKVDGKKYATINGSFQRYSLLRNLNAAHNWNNSNKMSPFDSEFYITIGVGVGGITDFPDDSITGPDRKVKPWRNRDPKNQLNFWKNVTQWYPTWTDQSKLIVDYVKVWAV